MLLDRAMNGPRAAVEYRDISWDEMMQQFRTLFLGGEELDTGISSAEKQSPVAAAHRILTNSFGLIPFGIYLKDGDARKAVEDNALDYVLKKRPNVK